VFSTRGFWKMLGVCFAKWGIGYTLLATVLLKNIGLASGELHLAANFAMSKNVLFAKWRRVNHLSL